METRLIQSGPGSIIKVELAAERLKASKAKIKRLADRQKALSNVIRMHRGMSIDLDRLATPRKQFERQRERERQSESLRRELTRASD